MPKTSAADNASDPKVSDLPCFTLFAAARAVANLYRPLLDRAGITYPQFLLLGLLWERDHRPVGELARELGLDYNTVSPLVKRLEGKGFLLRRSRPDDEEFTVLRELRQRTVV